LAFFFQNIVIHDASTSESILDTAFSLLFKEH